MRTTYLKTETVNDQVVYKINHPKFSALIAQFGGQLLSFKDNSDNEWLWLSDSAVLDGSTAIRGGTPICWPWFGPSSNPSLPQHGFARILKWDLISCEEDSSTVVVQLNCQLSHADIDLSSLSVVVEYILGDTITINVHTQNLTNKTLHLSQAIHTYLNVTSITETSVIGLDDICYIDKLNDDIESSHSDNLIINKHIDRVYKTDTNNTLVEAPDATYKITGDGHDSIVIWNPWQTLAKNMKDFDDLGYTQMLCVEMANTQDLQVGPKGSYTLSQTIKRVSR